MTSGGCQDSSFRNGCRSDELNFGSEGSQSISCADESSALAAMRPPCVGDWQVQSFGIIRFSTKDSNGAVLDRRLRYLVEDGHFTRQVIEILLCHHLSSTPLGADGDVREENSELADLALNCNASFSDSTVLFGASKSDLASLSEVPSHSITISDMKSDLASLSEVASHSASITDIRRGHGDMCSAKNNGLPPSRSDQPAYGSEEGRLGAICSSVQKPFLLMISAHSLIAKRRLSKDGQTGMPPIYFASQAMGS
jgi:hypothetical protein